MPRRPIPRALPCIGYARDGFVLLDAATGAVPRRFPDLSLYAISPDGRLALASADGKMLQLLDVETGAARLTFTEDTFRAAVSNGGARIATTIGSSTLIVRDAKGRALRRWSLRTQFATAPVLFPDGKRVAVASGRNLRVLGGPAARHVALAPKTDIAALALSPDGKLLLAVGAARRLPLPTPVAVADPPRRPPRPRRVRRLLPRRPPRRHRRPRRQRTPVAAPLRRAARPRHAARRPRLPPPRRDGGRRRRLRSPDRRLARLLRRRRAPRRRQRARAPRLRGRLGPARPRGRAPALALRLALPRAALIDGA